MLSIALITSILDLRLEERTAVLASCLADAKQELQFLALHDGLTKLPNRALLNDRLEQEIQNARREKSRFSVLCMDVDGFRQINDAWGHRVGDTLLVEVARRLRTSIRARDTLARLGGDEFVVLADVRRARRRCQSRRKTPDRSPRTRRRSTTASCASPSASASPCSTAANSSRPTSCAMPTPL